MNTGQISKSSSKSVGHLFRFMYIFGIDRFWIFQVTENRIKARIGWPNDGREDYDEDEEIQDIKWDIQTFDNIEDALEIVDFIIDNELINIDKVILSPEDLGMEIGWEKEKFDLGLKTLLDFRVDMLDDGKKSDFFFIHF